MNQNELKKAMNNHIPVYYIDDENYDYHCENTEYEVAEADVLEVYIPKQEIYGRSIYVQYAHLDGSMSPFTEIANSNIFSSADKADKEATRRFKCYVKNLRRQVKSAEEALAECEKRLKVLKGKE